MRILRLITSLCIFASTALHTPIAHAKSAPPTSSVAAYPGSLAPEAGAGWGPAGQGTQTAMMKIKLAVSTISVNDSLPVEVYALGPVSPTGTFVLSGGGYTSSAQTLVDGYYTFIIPANALAVGVDTLTATYSGDANFTMQTASATVTVTKAVPIGQSILGPVVTQLVAGAGHTCVITARSITTPETVQCWGSNSHGQLGDGTTTDSAVPVLVPSSTYASQNEYDVAVVALAAGDAHTCALVPATGVPVCWGANANGQLGNGTTMDSSTPIFVTGLSNKVAAIAAGSAHTCALTTDGTVQCWGNNAHGQLGDGSTTNSSSPLTVSGISGALSIAAAGNHSCALLSNHALKCWGENANGQLGNGSTVDSSTAVAVGGLGGNPMTLSLGGSHTCVLFPDGTSKCWGSNAHGQLGNGSAADSSTPVAVSTLVGATALIAGGEHTCAVVTAGGGSVVCWGSNAKGQLGDNTTTDSNVPVQVAGLNNAAALTAGLSHSCAQSAIGILECWGDNANGQLGNGTSQAGGVLTPLPVSGMGELAGALSMGDTYSCGLTAGGTAKLGAGGTLTTYGAPFCWGQNLGSLGDGTTQSTSVPVAVVGLGNKVKTLYSDTSNTCAIITDGSVQCWGNGSNGVLGNGTTTTSTTPVKVIGLTGSVTQMSVSSYFACGLITDGTVQCWGYNGFGSLGDGTTNNSTIPVKVVGVANAVAFSGDLFHACAVISDGTVKCWGDTVPTPTTVAGITTAKAITSGQDFNCALLADKTVTCWGRNTSGQLGNGTTSDSVYPTPPAVISGLTGVTAISAGAELACALLSDKTVECWGYNDRGGLGNGTTTNSSIPVKVIDLTNVTAISMGGESSIALVEGGVIEGWGSNLGAVFGDSIGSSSYNLPTDHYVFPISVFQGQSLAFHVPAAVALNSRTDLAPLATATGGLTNYFETFTQYDCVIDYNSDNTAFSVLYATQPLLCGVRAENFGGYNLHGGSLAPAPSQQDVILAGATTPAPQAILSPASLSFANVTVGATSTAQAITLSNPGDATLNIASITITGTNANLFAQTTTCSSTLPAGASCTLSVTFAPTVEGDASASLAVKDDAAGSPQTVSLSGTTKAAAAPQAALSPTTADFGSVTVGSTSSAQTFTLKNAGNAALSITSEGISGTNAAVFTIGSNNCSDSLAAGSSCTFTVTFTPTAAASASATLSIVDSVGTQSASLSATGTAAAAPQAALTPTSAMFGKVNVGSTSASQTFTLTNAGNAPLPITTISLGGTNASSFTLGKNTCGTSLASGSSCTIAVSFNPTTAGDASALLSVVDGVGTQSVSLTGTGVTVVAADFTIAATPATQTTNAGATVTYTIKLASASVDNPFTGPVVLSAAGLPGGTITFSPASVTPGSSGGQSTMSVQTTTQLATNHKRPSPWPVTAPILAALLLLLPSKRLRSRKGFVQLVCLVALFGIAASSVGCGGGFALPSTAKTYTLTVTGTSGAAVHSTTVTLTVQ